MANWYSTQPFLSWCLNYYFYNKTHYVYLTGEFYPYRLPNPRSSNPFLIYQQLYEPWKDRDEFDKFIAQQRLALQKGVKKKALDTALRIDTSKEKRLLDICDKLDIAFFYPVVYKVDIDPTVNSDPTKKKKVSPSRKTETDWSKRGSRECLVSDLQEDEYELLFCDFEGDPDFDTLKSGGATNPINILEARCKP